MPVTKPGDGLSEATRVLGSWLRDVITANPSNFRLFGPDETESNRLGNVFEVTNKQFEGMIIDGDNHLAPEGRVVEVLSEHLCQGWLEGYLLTGRHGLFNCYEAFIHIVDSMFNQHCLPRIVAQVPVEHLFPRGAMDLRRLGEHAVQVKQAPAHAT